MESGTPKPTLSLTPKQRFQLQPLAVKAHSALVHSDQFQASADAAMLEYANQLATDREYIGEHSHYMLRGAAQFLDTFKRLAETPIATKRKDFDNLSPVL